MAALRKETVARFFAFQFVLESLITSCLKHVSHFAFGKRHDVLVIGVVCVFRRKVGGKIQKSVQHKELFGIVRPSDSVQKISNAVTDPCQRNCSFAAFEKIDREPLTL